MKILFKGSIVDHKDLHGKSDKLIIRTILNRLRKKIKFLIFINVVLFVLIVYPEVDVLRIDLSRTWTTEIPVTLNPITRLIKNKTKCANKDLILEIGETDKYFIMKNYIRAARNFECDQSITYTTNGEFHFLDNIVPIVERWKAPISVAVYAPGSDFIAAMNIIFYLRNCSRSKDLVVDYVTFHIFFDKMDDRITNVLTLYETLEPKFKCYYGAKLLKMAKNDTFRIKNNLKYPINVGRNLARDAATTHFVLASDIELYPNPNFVQDFLKMIANDQQGKLVKEKNVFVLPVFEIELDVVMPDNKKDFMKLYNERKIFWFHRNICPHCHNIPEPDRWLNDTDYENMKIETTIKRHGKFYHWEPFYVGTNNDPFFDERLYYEGAADKMPQAYALCLLDYNFNILSTGFLIHKNGIKIVEEALVGFQDRKKFIIKQVVPEMIAHYGNISECRMF